MSPYDRSTRTKVEGSLLKNRETRAASLLVRVRGLPALTLWSTAKQRAPSRRWLWFAGEQAKRAGHALLIILIATLWLVCGYDNGVRINIVAHLYVLAPTGWLIPEENPRT